MHVYAYSCYDVGIEVDQHVFNFSDASLSHTEKVVLARGLNPGISLSGIEMENIFAEFEILHSQLKHHEPRSNDDFLYMKAKLAELAHSFTNSPINTRVCMEEDPLSGSQTSRDN